MIRKINQQVLLEILCFFLFAVVILYALITKKYLSYVTPRMVPYLVFAAAVMLVWAAFGIRDLGRRQYKIKAAHCLILIIPVICLLLPHQFLYASANSSGYLGSAGLALASGKSVQGAVQTGEGQKSVTQNSAAQVSTAQVSGNRPSGTDDGPRIADEQNGEEPVAIGETDSRYRDSIIQVTPKSTTAQPAKQSASQPADQSTSQSADKSTSQQGNQSAAQGACDNTIRQQYHLQEAADGSVQVSDDQFYGWNSEIFTNMKRYDGVKITIKGFVYKDPQTMGRGQFVPARMLMYCCAADVCPCGLLCSYDKADTLQDNSWVTVTGVIHIGQYQGKASPVISVTSVSAAQAPQDEYVYP